ncbi:unnamed protein product [Kuraishia capsulata CBS 1993]|uniref:DNA replication complex GINS protein PSF3 n=1 Tax=Kuraishia capsulata CBS 1993 TaxID=1382522 RepID=W6MI92_9ASCO|nr:uncharacterized protein KUCA_T00001583001 [Kuraishia capsulata CBS 1993]CDK25613.1 unnamed protein product [Kuraishia capsulata CBS 1993]
MEYYDIDDIIADSQRLPVKFQISVPGLGYLEGNPGKQVSKDSRMELPLWLALILAICPIDDSEDSGQNFVELLPPEFLSAKVQNAIKSSPATIDLHSILPHFYNFVVKWCWLFEDAQLVQLCLDMLRERAAEINSRSSNSTARQNLDQINKLDEFEKRIFKLNYDSFKDLKQWLAAQHP